MPADADDAAAGDPHAAAAFCCVAALTPRSTLAARLAHAFRAHKHRPPNVAVAAAVDAAVTALTSAAADGASGLGPTSPTAVATDDGGGGGGATPTCRLLRGGSLTAEGQGGAHDKGNSRSSVTVETCSFATAGLACRLAVIDCLAHCPVMAAGAAAGAAGAAGAPSSSSSTAPSTLARVLPYTLVAPEAFVAAVGSITNADDLARRFDDGRRRPSRRGRDQQQQQHHHHHHHHDHRLPPPSIAASVAAVRDAALAEEVAGLSLTPPSGGHASPSSSSMLASAAISGVRRAVGVGEATARALLMMFDEALESATFLSSAASAVEALTLALSAVEGSFALVVHDEGRGVTLAARAASGDEGTALWYALPAAAAAASGADKGGGGGVVIIASEPLDLPGVTTAGGGGGGSWREVPAGHFLLHGLGRGGGLPRLHQFALTPEQLRRRTHDGPPIAAAPDRWRAGAGAAADDDDFASSAAPVGSLNSGTTTLHYK